MQPEGLVFNAETQGAESQNFINFEFTCSQRMGTIGLESMQDCDGDEERPEDVVGVMSSRFWHNKDLKKNLFLES